MSQLLGRKVECIKGQLEKKFHTRLAARSDSSNCYPDLFELWTLFNVIKAMADSENSGIYGAGSYMNQGVITIVAGDVHPSGRAHGATAELIGLGMAPTITVSSKACDTSIWYDKYAGVSLDGKYWPRPDIAIRKGGYDILKSVSLETSANGNKYIGGYDIRRGFNYSETTRGWRSLADLLRADPQLRSLASELVNNFKIRRALISIVSNDRGEVQAVAGQPSEELPSDGTSYIYGNIQADDCTVFWARKKSFVQPDRIIECKSGFLTPHAIDQLLAYRTLFSRSQIIVATTRTPDRNVALELQRNCIEIVAPPESMGWEYSHVLRLKLGEGEVS
jgi:hypothetical protein